VNHLNYQLSRHSNVIPGVGAVGASVVVPAVWFAVPVVTDSIDVDKINLSFKKSKSNLKAKQIFY